MYRQYIGTNNNSSSRFNRTEGRTGHIFRISICATLILCVRSHILFASKTSDCKRKSPLTFSRVSNSIVLSIGPRYYAKKTDFSFNESCRLKCIVQYTLYSLHLLCDVTNLRLSNRTEQNRESAVVGFRKLYLKQPNRMQINNIVVENQIQKEKKIVEKKSGFVTSLDFTLYTHHNNNKLYFVSSYALMVL